MHAALALALLGSASASASALQLPFRRLEHNITTTSLDRDLLARATPALRATNDPCVDGYVLDVLVGTPPQPMSLRVDVHSAATWLPGEQVVQRFAPIRDCSVPGMCVTPFYPQNSSTFAPEGTNLTATRLRGVFFRDTLVVGGHAMPGALLGLGILSQWEGRGALGLGAESAVLRQMVAAGVIEHPSFSLSWSPDYRSGKILFGGIDAAQFTGPLSTVPLMPDHGPSFAVSVEGISLDGDNNNSSSSSSTSTALPAVSGRAILEANSENMALPPALAHAINRRYGVVGVPCSFLNYTYYIADCGLRERLAHESISVRFAGGVAVKVPLGQLVIPYVNAATEERALEMIRDDPAHPMASWDGRCAWTLRPIEEAAGENEGDDWILGAPFMRSAYVVFDTLNKQVGLAQAKSGVVSDDAETRIVPIPKDAKHFPA